MYNSFPFTSYIPRNRSATANLTGGDILTITASGVTGTSNKKAFLVYTTNILFTEISPSSSATAQTPGLGSFQCPANTYNFVVPINPGCEIKFSPINTTASYSLVWLA